MPKMDALAGRGDFSAILKDIDARIDAAAGSPQIAAQLLCNRGLCHQRLNLSRKALKVVVNCAASMSSVLDPSSLPWRAHCRVSQDYDAALQAQPQHVLALLRKGEVLTALKKPQVHTTVVWLAPFIP